MLIDIAEQETVIRFDRTENTMTIYTSDTTMMTRLNKLYPIVKLDTNNGKTVAITYRAPKRFLTLRRDPEYKPEYHPKRKISKERVESMIKQRRNSSEKPSL